MLGYAFRIPANDTQDLQEFRPLGRNLWTEWEGNLFFCVYPFVPFEKIIIFTMYIHALAPYYIHNTLITYKCITLLSTFIKYRAVIIPLTIRIPVNWSRRSFINVHISGVPCFNVFAFTYKTHWMISRRWWDVKAQGGEKWNRKGCSLNTTSWYLRLSSCQ